MKRFVVFSIMLFCSFAWGQTAKSVITEACKKESADQSISYMEKTLPSITVPAEKRGVYIYLAGVQEKLGRFSEAQKNYASAAAIAGGDAEGMPKKTSEQLVLDAVRCALCGGEGDTAQNYLNSAVRSSKNPEVAAFVKLYDQWALLVKAENLKDTEEVIAMLKTYSELESMKSVHPQIFLTLWHLTGKSSYADSLKKKYPGSTEELIVSGKVNLKPSPFWYFVPRSGEATPDVASAAETKPVTAETPAENQSKDKNGSGTAKNKVIKQQLGLFKDKDNAQNLVKRLKEKGFTGQVTSEVRPSGTTYYIVSVNENKAGTIGEELRTAGFECCPLFE